MENVINGGKTCHLAISATFLASLREHLGFSRAEETGCSRELVFFRQLASYFIILRSPPRLRELCFIPLASNFQAVKITAIQKSLSTGRTGELQISISQEFRKYWPFWKGNLKGLYKNILSCTHQSQHLCHIWAKSVIWAVSPPAWFSKRHTLKSRKR